MTARPHSLQHLNAQNRQILIRVDSHREGSGGDPKIDKHIPRSLPLALEGVDTAPSSVAAAAKAGTAASSSSVVSYRLLDPEAAVGQLKLKWSELVEPPAAADRGSGDGASSGDGTPWARGLGIGSDSDSVSADDGDVR